MAEATLKSETKEVTKSIRPVDKKKVEFDKTIGAMFLATEHFNANDGQNLYKQLRVMEGLFAANKGAKEYTKEFGYKIDDFIYQHSRKEKGGNLSSRKVTFRDIWDAIRDFTLEFNICYDWDETTGLPREYTSDDSD